MGVVNELLKYKEDDIEIFISDNCSTDNTISKLLEIEDIRLRWDSNKENIGAIPNYIKAMLGGSGQYVFFFTDKDYVDVSGVTNLINFLREHPSVLAGYFNLNTTSIKEPLIFKSGFDSLSMVAYLSRHPTGYFFESKIFHRLALDNKYSNVSTVGSFPFEFIIAEVCMLGETAVLNIPLCFIESLDDVKSVKSYTYSGSEDNLYFSPYQRYIQFQKYMGHLEKLHLSIYLQILIASKLFYQSLGLCLFEYKAILNNSVVCEHYAINVKHLGLLELSKIYFRFCVNFIIKFKSFSVFERLVIFFIGHFKFLTKVISKLAVNI